MFAPPLIRTTALTRSYTLGKNVIRALNHVDFSLAEGRFIAVVGPSGSGKSTFLNLVGGLDTPTSGTIEVGGSLISEMGKNELAVYRRSEVGMIFQSFNLIPSRTARENVELPLVLSGCSRRARRERAVGLLDEVGLGNRRDHRPFELSGGEQQRVAVARALANNPRILLADEPTGNLDSATSREILRLISDLNSRAGLTVVMVTHEEALVRDFAQEIARLRDGEVVAVETV
jgi:putative ABC transport system ATP-binding protein